MNKRTRTTRISARIADAIRKGIATGSLRTGDRLPAERTMVRRHRVSRVSVREAYRALQDTGVVTVRRGSTGGAFIAAPAPSVIAESLSIALRLCDGSERQVREASLVEPVVAALAARHATPAELSRLQKLAATRPTRAGHFEQHRLRFHRALADCAHNIALAAVVDCLAEVSAAWHPDVEGAEGYPERARGWHVMIVDAVAAQDEATASLRMLEYLRWLQGEPVPSPSPVVKSDAGVGLGYSAA
jgi:GntR family transcriptional repressor for pyruvate dehydrogenase complex